ncbi:hypothetical protein [Spirillospora sp. NPDC048819]|uniref:hypothetical protein n=1 Tax=Spirillospora sp. NPDC048819 TaxID=3155268 RepID=UPI0033FFE8A7
MEPASGKRPKHALPQQERLWPPSARPFVAFGVATALAALSLLWTVSDDHNRPPGTPVLVPPAAASPSREAPPASPTSAATRASLSPSPSPTRSTAGPSRRAAKVDLTRPDDGDVLFDDDDFTVEGNVSGLGDDDLRIFIFDEDDETFYLADYGPEDVGGDGPWDIRSTGIGTDFGRDGDTYLVQAVLADRSCRRSLDGLELGNDRYPDFRDLPDGCRVGDQVRVEED